MVCVRGVRRGPQRCVREPCVDDQHRAAAAGRAVTQGAAGEFLVQGSSTRLGFLDRLGHGQQAAAQGQAFAAGSGQESVVADAPEPPRQHVHQKAADELASCEAGALALVVMAVVAPMEVDTALLNGHEAVIGDGHAVRVAGEVGEHAGGAVEGRLGVNHPLALAQLAQPALEGGGLGQCGQRPLQGEFAAQEGGLELAQEEGAKAPREDAHGQEEAGAAGDPALPVGGQAAAGDRKIRLNPLEPMNEGNGVTGKRIRAMIDAGVKLVTQGAGTVPTGIVHRLDKADTSQGLKSVQSVADLGAPYPVLLYERFLGRPYATHRDSVSELVGEVVESAIKNVLTDAKVSFRETKHAEKIPGFDQMPDFIIPDEFTPVALIEAKLTEDDGTARDKVARVQRLRTLRDEEDKDYDVIACIAGRGFKVTREDMRRMLQSTDGKVFTLATMHLLIDHTRIWEYRVR